MKKAKGLWILVAVVFSVAVLQASAAAAAEKYVTFGQTESLTGPLAGFGVPNRRIVELAIEKINNEGGFKVKGETYKLKVICEDNKNTTEGAIAANNKLIHQDKVKIVMNFPTTPAIASQVVTEQNKVINLIAGLHHEMLSPKKPYSFRHFMDATVTAPGQVKWIIKNRPELKSSWMTGADDASGAAGVDGWNEACKKYGIKVLGSDLISRQVTDFYPLLAKILPNNPAVIGSNTGDGGALLLKQAREKGYKGTFVTPYAASKSWIKTGGAENMEGTLNIGIDANSELVPKGVRDFHAAYVKKYGEEPGAWSDWQTTPPYIIAQALAKAGTVDDVEKIKAVLEKEMFDAPWGKVKYGGAKKFGIPRQLLIPVFISTVKNGNIVVLDRISGEEIEKIMSE
jgi:branched-chain amino acid transport system substrate-binding protein